MENPKKINKEDEEKINVALKANTILLLDEVARKKVNQAIKKGSLDIINLIRSKRGRGVSYNSQINYLARIYLGVVDETLLNKDFVAKNPQLKKCLDRLNEINSFFLKVEYGKGEEKLEEEKINVSLKADTILLLDEVARKKVEQAIKKGSLDIINLIRSKRGRGVSYDSEINYLARIYLAVVDETVITQDLVAKNPQLKKVLDRLNDINNFFLNTDD